MILFSAYKINRTIDYVAQSGIENKEKDNICEKSYI